MGEMADYALEMNVFTPDDLGFDGFDTNMDDGYGNVISRPQRTLRCKFCSTLEVHWHNTKDGWRLYDDKSGCIHSCRR